MDASQREQLKVLFTEALDLPAQARDEFVAEACGGDAELRTELASLLGAYDASAGYFEELAERVVAPALAAAGGGAGEEFAAGETVSHYEVLGRLGGGGMGVVYQARDLRLGRPVALKFLPPALVADGAARARLVAEAKAASALDHPNIAVVHEIAETEGGRPFIAMAWYEGETLKEKLARGPLPVPEALHLAAQLADALAAAHRAGIVHRDVKPANVLVTREGVAKLLDFGIAKITGVELTGEGATPGTLAYMSPEQTQGRTVDARTDLWSLGVVLYEMLAGRRPFPAEDEPALIHAIRHDEPEPLARLRPELPVELVEIVAACLQRDPARRYATAEELRRELHAVAAGERVEATSLPRRRRRSSGRLPRPGWVSGAVAALLLLGIASGVYLELLRVDRAGGTLLGRGVLAERERILLADFASPTGDSLLAGLATEAFRIDLAQSPVLRLVEPQQVRQALGRMQRSDAGFLDVELARELAVREGIKAVLAGEILRTGGEYLVSAQLLSAGSGEILAAHRETAADSTALLPALDRLSKRVRRRIGESLRSVRSDAPLDRVTTGSLDALRKYSQALRVLQVEGDRTRGVALLEEAIALDSTFAMAHGALGLVLSGERERHRGVEALTRAFELRDRLTDRERYLTMAGYYSEVTGEREKAIAAYRTLLDRYPQDLMALANLGALYRHLRDWARAEEFYARAWQADSTRFETLASVVEAQFNQGKFEQAETNLRRLAARFPGNWRPALLAILMAAARGDYGRAESLAVQARQAMRDDHRVQGELAVRLAYLTGVRGRLLEAERYMTEAIEIDRRTGRLNDGLSATLELIAADLLLRRDRVKGLERLEQALAEFPLASIPPYERPYPGLVFWLAAVGEPERARGLFDEWQALVPADPRRRPESYYNSLGEIALAEGRPLDAVEHFRLASTGRMPALTELGRAFDRAGQVDSAIARYEEFLETPDIRRLRMDAGYLAFVLERLGQLHEARGDQARAAEYYARFIELWQDADEDLHPRVREARRRLAALH